MKTPPASEPDDKLLDEAFAAFEAGIRPRSVLDVEADRVARGHLPDEALLKHGADLGSEILHELTRKPNSAEILKFPALRKPEGA